MPWCVFVCACIVRIMEPWSRNSEQCGVWSQTGWRSVDVRVCDPFHLCRPHTAVAVLLLRINRGRYTHHIRAQYSGIQTHAHSMTHTHTHVIETMKAPAPPPCSCWSFARMRIISGSFAYYNVDHIYEVSSSGGSSAIFAKVF